ncbi:diaminobutyrate acetyltransferase [Aliibacillus thermotolerans]|uniref:L-2,4-diaminobutyric acid acetyltransferase n=1 Tax=Aliibacillus thermotolerans TaxID=1834418 RepID=A0ABW0U486_9BACI|nr:diaminobutyrate acetyltransferase [Aliibacillus thermotolerans]MDA3129887.1 diaminobutyrate acetyltransferase [Aliibacillus thermotolerans]
MENEGGSPVQTVDSLTFEKPTAEDGAAMWELVKNSTLDLNSSYKYIMMAEFFSETCVVAKEKGELVGFVTGFILPEKQDTVFVWQIGVDPSQRGKGLATRLLNHLVERTRRSSGVNYLEATVTPSNEASQALFRKLARTYDTACEVSECFSEDLFPGEEHEAELSFRIGPFSKE